MSYPHAILGAAALLAAAVAFAAVSGPHATMEVPALKITISLAEIYAGVEFSEAEEFRRPVRG